MFYRRNIIDGKVGVVDTQDGVCEVKEGLR